MTKDQYLGFQRGPRPEQSDQRQPDQAASFSHKAEALRDSASVASRIRFPTGTTMAEASWRAMWSGRLASGASPSAQANCLGFRPRPAADNADQHAVTNDRNALDPM